jgi:hypothetical protein
VDLLCRGVEESFICTNFQGSHSRLIATLGKKAIAPLEVWEWPRTIIYWTVFLVGLGSYGKLLLKAQIQVASEWQGSGKGIKKAPTLAIEHVKMWRVCPQLGIRNPLRKTGPTCFLRERDVLYQIHCECTFLEERIPLLAKELSVFLMSYHHATQYALPFKNIPWLS